MPKKIKMLTPEQEKQMKPWAAKWIEEGLRTDPIDMDRFTDAARRCYSFAGLNFPATVVRVDSPLVGALSAGIADSIGSAVDSAVYSAVDSSVDSPVYSAVDSAIDSPVRSAVYSAVNSAVDSAVDSAVRSAVYSAVNSAVGSAVDSAVRKNKI